MAQSQSQVKGTEQSKIEHQPKYSFGKSYTFRLRQHMKDNFSGLWEFSIIDDNGKVIKMISDADALNFCIDNLMGELENDGF